MNFPQHLIHWTRLCYDNITSRVLVNKQLTDPFPIQSGVRQGSPGSTWSLFSVKSDPPLHPGLPPPGGPDIPIVDNRSIALATKVVEDYSAATGALVNRDKSELYLSQHWKEPLSL